MLTRTHIIRQFICIDNALAFKHLTDSLYSIILKGLRRGCKSIVFVCIGTDRSTGDSLGPLVGYKTKSIRQRNVYIFGNLDNPVHARNLNEVMVQIRENFDNPFVIAVDACLGKAEHIGYINVGEGSIKPGSGVKKDLMAVGDAYITGIVNFGGFMDFLILQNTRLSIVMKMADLISESIKYVLWKISSDPAFEGMFARE